MAGHGEAAITDRYSNLVAGSRIVSPLPNKVDAKVFTAAARRNYIDALVLKLATLNIPSFRRVYLTAKFMPQGYLDAAGILPTPAEVRKFLTDKSSDKRAGSSTPCSSGRNLYCRRLQSSTCCWISTKLQRPGRGAYQFIRQSVADNKPWDRFAHQIVTANRSTLRNGAANYFVLHKEVTDLTEATALTFMGMSITCCRCHDQPLENGAKDQYWSMADLFGRVALENRPTAAAESWCRRSPWLPATCRTPGGGWPCRGAAGCQTACRGQQPGPPSLFRLADRGDNRCFARALTFDRVWRRSLGRVG